MLYQRGKRIEVVAEATPEAFAERLNSKLAALDRTKSKYELMFNHNMGYCAYLVIDKTIEVPETAKDHFMLREEVYHCLNCPKWKHPTKGNVKYTYCETVGWKVGAKDKCCEQFYEWLENGEITPEEVDDNA